MFNRKNVINEVASIGEHISKIFKEYPEVTYKINGVKPNYYSTKFVINTSNESKSLSPSSQFIRASEAIDAFNISQSNSVVQIRKTTVGRKEITFAIYIERLEVDGTNAAQQEKLDEFTSSYPKLSGIRLGDVIGSPGSQWKLIEMRPRNTKFPFIVKEASSRYKVSLEQMNRRLTDKQSKAFKLRNIKEQ
jgi:hypothetical protein